MEADLFATRLVDALGTAWMISSLYPEPAGQPAFHRAVETVAEAADRAVTLDVTVDGFSHAGEPIQATREGADRLARRCFVHQVESLTIIKAPASDHLLAIFSALRTEDAEVRATGGLEAVLAREAIDSIRVVQRAMLHDVGADAGTIERHGRVEAVLSEGADPESFAQALVEEAASDGDALAELFHRRYHETLDLVDEADLSGREDVVRAFVEAFFYLDESFQVLVFARFLAAGEEADRFFVDQFAGHELARLAPKLDTRGLALLLDYAKVSTDQADRRPDELLALLRSQDALESARNVVAAEVQKRLGEFHEAAEATPSTLETLRRQFPDPANYLEDALEVFRGLMNVEGRDDRFARLLRIWTGKVAAAIRAGDYSRAERWLAAVEEDPTYDRERVDDVRRVRRQMVGPELLAALVGSASESASVGAPMRVLTALGSGAVEQLVELLAEEESPARRKTLIDLLAATARERPAVVASRLTDPRWFVVRNLLTVAGRAGRQEILPSIVATLGHDDHRVRVEALRAMQALQAPETVEQASRSLQDPSEVVRGVAIGILGVQRGAAAEAALIAGLQAGGLSVAENQRIIRLLGEAGSPRAVAELERIAGRRFALSAGTRQLRDAARRALRSARRTEGTR